jgi:hypothetical protein
MLLLCFVPLAAHADPGEFLAGRLSFQIPPQWTSEGKKAKLTLVSPGEDAFIVLSLLQAGDENALRAQTAALLNQYLADVALSDSGEKTSFGALSGLRFKGTGSSDATSVAFIAALVGPERATPVMVLAYTTQSSFAGSEKLFEDFLHSLKPR